jgi:hypothetical protein
MAIPSQPFQDSPVGGVVNRGAKKHPQHAGMA